MNRAVGENGFSSIRIFMEIGVVVCLNLGIIGDILKMADNFVGQIMGVQKFMPVGNRMPGEYGIKDFCQLPFTVLRIIGLLRGKTRILCYVRMSDCFAELAETPVIHNGQVKPLAV